MSVDVIVVSCIFCKIVNEEAEAVILHEDEQVMAFLDIRPVNDGHFLVIPKKHHQRIETIDDPSYLRMFSVARGLMMKVQRAFPDITGFNFLIANGKDAGQEIFHAHLHVIPRKPNDGFGFKFGPNYGRIASLEERQRVAREILESQG